MDNFKVSINDIRLLFAVAIVLPLLCFVMGMYVANTMESNNATGPKNFSGNITQASPVMKAAPGIKLVEIKPVQSDSYVEDKHVAVVQRKPLNREFDNKFNSEKLADKSAESANQAVLPAKGEYAVQAGLFASYDNANKMHKRLNRKKIDNTIIDTVKAGDPVYRIILSQFASKDEAKQYLQDVKENHHLVLCVVHLEPAFQRSRGFVEEVAAL